jgi:hypothetical protein
LTENTSGELESCGLKRLQIKKPAENCWFGADYLDPPDLLELGAKGEQRCFEFHFEGGSLITDFFFALTFFWGGLPVLWAIGVYVHSGEFKILPQCKDYYYENHSTISVGTCKDIAI